MSTSLRVLLLVLGMLVLGIAPALAESGQATGKRQHKPVRFRAYIDQSVNLDGEDFTIGSLMEEEGICYVLLPSDSDIWDWDLLQALVSGPKAESFANVAIIAVYPNTKYVHFAQEDIDHLAEFMTVSLIDSNTRAFLPEVGDEVLLAFFAAPDAQYRGAFRSVSGLAYELEAVRH